MIALLRMLMLWLGSGSGTSGVYSGSTQGPNTPPLSDGGSIIDPIG